MNLERNKGNSLNILQLGALVFILVGALISIILTLHAGRHNNSIILKFFFAVWVLSPFTALLAANIVSRNWSSRNRRFLYWLILFLATGSLILYSGVFHLSEARPAFIFLITPLISWLIMISVILMARKST